MDWNLEPMGGVDPQALPPNVPPTPLNAWGQWLGQMGQGLGRAAAQGLQQLPSAPAEDPAALQRQLRMERARQDYERRFGSAYLNNPANASLAAQGKQADVNSLLERVRAARQVGWRPGG